MTRPSLRTGVVYALDVVRVQTLAQCGDMQRVAVGQSQNVQRHGRDGDGATVLCRLQVFVGTPCCLSVREVGHDEGVCSVAHAGDHVGIGRVWALVL